MVIKMESIARYQTLLDVLYSGSHFIFMTPMPILQRRKLRPREVRTLAQGRAAKK